MCNRVSSRNQNVIEPLIRILRWISESVSRSRLGVGPGIVVLVAVENLDDVVPLVVIEVSSDHGGMLTVGVDDLAQSLSLGSAFGAIVVRGKVGVEESELLTANIGGGPHGNSASVSETSVARAQGGLACICKWRSRHDCHALGAAGK